MSFYEASSQNEQMLTSKIITSARILSSPFKFRIGSCNRKEDNRPNFYKPSRVRFECC